MQHTCLNVQNLQTGMSSKQELVSKIVIFTHPHTHKITIKA